MRNVIVGTILLLFAAGCARLEKPAPPEPVPIVELKPPVVEVKPEPIEAAVISDEEKNILKNLEAFNAKFELDKKAQVVRVVLEGKQVTDAALDEVVKLPNPKSLSLARSSVTDAGLVKLQEMVWLENLGVTDTPVTDQGLKHLEKIPTLRNVWVCENDQLTKEGIASLRQALIGVNVHVMNVKKK